jgi:hypothetical protein
MAVCLIERFSLRRVSHSKCDLLNRLSPAKDIEVSRALQ